MIISTGEKWDRPNLIELYSVVFAELITTDVIVQFDMPVPHYTVVGSF